MKRNKRSMILMAAGVCLILCAAALLLYNLQSDRAAGESAAVLLSHLEEQMPEVVSEAIVSHVSMETDDLPELPVADVDGRSLIGKLEIPALELMLPVLAGWNDASANIAPCRYKGSPYDGSLILAGHNYKSQFGRLSSLSVGDSVVYTDMLGNQYPYEVSETEILGQYDIAGMDSGDWELTLYTCTLSGTERLTIRCVSK